MRRSGPGRGAAVVLVALALAVATGVAAAPAARAGEADSQLLARDYLRLAAAEKAEYVSRLMVGHSARYRGCYAQQTVEEVANAFDAWLEGTRRVHDRSLPEAFSNYLVLKCP
ncbi:MAG: hypothetical protein JSW68_11050 [Burkholderiales bacterium]|nr:MAG: hypothetical protein JSW68_11050 [Burkholderiales bacterium]